MTDLTATEAEQVTSRIRQWVKTFPVEDVTRAFEGRVWIALGYESWDEWCDCELGGFTLRAPQRKEVVAALAETGMSNRVIAEVVGVGKDTVNRDLAAAGANEPPERTVTGKDGKTYKPKPKPEPEPEPEPDDSSEDEMTEEEWTASMQRTREALRARDKANNTGRFIEMENKVGGLMRRLREMTDIIDGVTFTDDESEILVNDLGKVRARISLIELSLSGGVEVDWDTEFQKITPENN